MTAITTTTIIPVASRVVSLARISKKTDGKGDLKAHY